MSITVDLLKVCRDITLDGMVSGDEAWELADWLNKHPQSTTRWPGDKLAGILEEVFSDGEIDESELYRFAVGLGEIEREAARRLDRIPPDDFGPPPVLRTRISEPPPLLAGPPELPVIDLETEVLSSAGDDYYKVNLTHHTCTCHDWVDRRSHNPSRHIGRMCKHIAAAFGQLAASGEAQFTGPMKAVLENCLGRQRGTLPHARYVSLETKYGPVLLGFGTSDWIDVIAPSGKGFQRYGFNTMEARWAYGDSPKGARPIREAITKEMMR